MIGANARRIGIECILATASLYPLCTNACVFWKFEKIINHFAWFLCFFIIIFASKHCTIDHFVKKTSPLSMCIGKQTQLLNMLPLLLLLLLSVMMLFLCVCVVEGNIWVLCVHVTVSNRTRILETWKAHFSPCRIDHCCMLLKTAHQFLY